MADGTREMAGWAGEMLAAPGGGEIEVSADGTLVDVQGKTLGIVQDGIVRMRIVDPDSSIHFYRKVGGAHFHERRSVSYAMTTLDTPVYRRYLAQIRPDKLDLPVVDVGGGDGRNAVPWLEWGYRRVVVIDPAFDALARLKYRIAQSHPEWLDRILLIEADARQLPLRSGSASAVQAIEALAYLNDDYQLGLDECVRLLRRSGRLLVSDRDYEAGLITRLFYNGGINGLLSQAKVRSILDGNNEEVVTSRCFTAAEFRDVIGQAELEIEQLSGISGLSLLLGYERANSKLTPEDEGRLADVHALLVKLGTSGSFLRSHVAIARRR